MIATQNIPGLDLKEARLFRTQCFLDGEWLDADSGDTITVLNPSSRQPVGTVPAMGVAETRRAIAAAERALPAWSARPACERAALLRRWFDLIILHREDLARILTAEQGKPLAEARAEVDYGASFIEWFSEEAKRIYGDTIPAKNRDRRIVVLKQAIGVCAAITPWNFPIAMIAKKVSAALAAGCTVVAKPSELTPFSALALAELSAQAGINPGVISIITGEPAEIGGELTANSVVRQVSFTGSTEVGRLLMRQCAESVKRLSLELGGNAPFIVFGDADIDAAVEGVMASKFRNTGQTCICANRIFVQEKIHDAFARKLTEVVSALKVGDGFEPGVQQGPLIDDFAVDKVEAHLADARAKGAKVLIGGQRHSRGGTFFQPTIIVEARPDMLLAREETFGPVAPLFRFGTEAEVIRLANATEYGLAAYFYGRDIGQIWRVAEALEFGVIGVNTGAMSTEVAPFGGMKQSGIGREGSKYGIEEFVEIKYVCFGGI